MVRQTGATRDDMDVQGKSTHVTSTAAASGDERVTASLLTNVLLGVVTKTKRHDACSDQEGGGGRSYVGLKSLD